jgi:hypothetical protein
MKILMKFSVLLAATLAAGCAYMPPVNLEATPADMELLAGRWDGEYSSPALGRRGTVEFKLVAGAKEASGDVQMIPQGSGRPYAPDTHGQPADGSPTPATTLLTIRFVRASSGEISGMLDPYWDPDRNCQAHTAFSGRLEQRTIDGTFTTTFDCGPGEASGHWRVTRKASAPAKKPGKS